MAVTDMELASRYRKCAPAGCAVKTPRTSGVDWRRGG
jgi:hypothetical protein